MSTPPKFKRKIYFINKEFQGRLIFNYFILLALGSVLFIAIFSFFSSNTLSIVYDNYHLQLGTTPGILFKKILSTQWWFIVLGGLAIGFITLRLTHRVAGPFYRFEKTLESMLEGDLNCRIFLRGKDEGKDLAGKINTFNEKLMTDLESITQSNLKIAEATDQLAQQLAEHNLPECATLVETLNQGRKEIETKLNTYTFTK